MWSPRKFAQTIKRVKCILLCLCETRINEWVGVLVWKGKWESDCVKIEKSLSLPFPWNQMPKQPKITVLLKGFSWRRQVGPQQHYVVAYAVCKIKYEIALRVVLFPSWRWCDSGLEWWKPQIQCQLCKLRHSKAQRRWLTWAPVSRNNDSGSDSGKMKMIPNVHSSLIIL